eukprot:365601-Chlamydomonas_euryale.AAC.3
MLQRGMYPVRCDLHVVGEGRTARVVAGVLWFVRFGMLCRFARGVLGDMILMPDYVSTRCVGRCGVHAWMHEHALCGEVWCQCPSV